MPKRPPQEGGLWAIAPKSALRKPAATSKALAKLAADYLNLTDTELAGKAVLAPAALLRDIRKLAASVLRQVEGDGK